MSRPIDDDKPIQTSKRQVADAMRLLNTEFWAKRLKPNDYTTLKASCDHEMEIVLQRDRNGGAVDE